MRLFQNHDLIIPKNIDLNQPNNISDKNHNITKDVSSTRRARTSQVCS
jgi:hypothetical protein